MNRIAVTPLSAARSAATDRTRPRAAPGRYDRLREARVPADGVGRSPAGKRADLALGAVADPYEDGKIRIQVTIDRRVDILEEERSHKRISEAAYLTGRQIQALLEKLNHLGSVSWDGASRGDPVVARERRHKTIIENAAAVKALEAGIIGRIGMIDWRLIRRIVGDRTSFSDCAAKEGKAGVRGTTYIAHRFRDALEHLAEALAARGKGQPTPDDDYKAAAPLAPVRQAASLRGGTTRRRLEGELQATIDAIPKAPTARERGRLQADVGDLTVRLVQIERLVPDDGD